MGIKDWFGGDKKKAAYRDKVKEAVSDGKLSSTDMQDLAKLREQLDVTDAADDKTELRRDLYNDGMRIERTVGHTILRFKNSSDSTSEILGELLSALMR